MPKFKVGDRVRYTVNSSSITGVITRVDGRYTKYPYSIEWDFSGFGGFSTVWDGYSEQHLQYEDEFAQIVKEIRDEHEVQSR